MSPAPLAFVHVPKTGGTSVKHLLRATFGLAHCDVQLARPDAPLTAHELRRLRRVYPVLRTLAGHALIAPTRHLGDAVRCFTVLREPVARLASAYLHALRGARGAPPSAAEFAQVARDGQVWQLTGGGDVDAAKEALRRYVVVGLTERLDASLDHLARLADLPLATAAPRLNRAPDAARGASALDPEALARFAEVTPGDRELYRWAIEELWPRQVERAAAAPAPDPRRPSALRERLSRGYNKLVYRGLVARPRRRAGRRAR